VARGHANLHWGWTGLVGTRLVWRALPVLCRAARGGPAATRGVHPGARAAGTGLLVLLSERGSVLPVRQGMPGRVDAGGAAAGPTGTIASRPQTSDRTRGLRTATKTTDCLDPQILQIGRFHGEPQNPFWKKKTLRVCRTHRSCRCITLPQHPRGTSWSLVCGTATGREAQNPPPRSPPSLRGNAPKQSAQRNLSEDPEASRPVRRRMPRAPTRPEHKGQQDPFQRARRVIEIDSSPPIPRRAVAQARSPAGIPLTAPSGTF
jgi:hypothetical protein